MQISPSFQSMRVCAPVESAMGSMISANGLPQIVWTIGVFRLLCLLGVVTGTAKIMIQQCGRDLVSDDGFDGGQSNVDFAASMVGRPIHSASSHFRLINRRHRLRLPLQAAFHPPELRSVQCRHVDHTDGYIAAVVDELATQRIRESCNGMFSSTI